MTTFGWVRYVIALLLLVTGPGSVLFWVPIHPLTRTWRRIGYRWAYVTGFGVYVLSGVVLAVYRRPLLSIQFGTSVPAIVLGLLLIAAAIGVKRRRQRYLTARRLFGLPQLAPDRFPSTLLTEGAYARVRHPRYAEVLLATLGYALICNYLAAYGVVVFLVLSFLVLIPMEERELGERFGPAYEEYRRRVPAIVPRLRRAAPR